MNSSEFTKRQELIGEVISKNLVLILFGVIIIFINSLLVYTFFKNPVFAQEPRYILYMQLVINDMIILSVCVILFVCIYLVPNMTVAVCCIFIFIASNTYKNTPLTLAGMAIERYVAVCYPLHHAQLCTVRNTKILIGIIWLVGALPIMLDLSVVLALCPLSFFTTGRKCYHQNVLHLEYNLISHAVCNNGYMFLVWVLLFYTYFKVLFSAKAAALDPSQARKARRTILLHGVQLLLCTLSLFTSVMDGALTALFPYYQSVIYFCNFIMTSILPRLLSPLIYGIRDKKFKKYIKSSLKCGSKKGAIKPSV